MTRGDKKGSLDALRPQHGKRSAAGAWSQEMRGANDDGSVVFRVVGNTNRIFGPADDSGWHRHAQAGGDVSTYVYAWGYREAADELVELAVAKRMGDVYFFPICFLYRHSMEVTLKDLVEQADRFIRAAVRLGWCSPDALRDEAKVKEKLEKTHSLLSLFQDLTARLALVSDETMPEAVVAAVRELHSLDADGQTFRYAWRKDGSASLPDTATYDLGRIRSEVGRAIEFLAYGVGGWLDAALKNAAEQATYAEEMRREYEDDMRREYESEIRAEHEEYNSP